MKKFLSTTAIVGTLFAIAAGSAMADASSGDIKLNGTMGAICVVDVDAKNTDIDMKDGAKKQVVAEIKETCNDHEGYTITFTSANEGVILHRDSGQSVPYTVSYDSSEAASLAKPLDIVRAKEGYGVEHNLVVDMSGSANRVAGSYGDTITVQIAAK